MPDQILPIGNLGQTGLILDNPPVSLPPGAFSDARNVRFRDGAVRKMEGEVNLFPDIFDPIYSGGLATNKNETLKYVAWWPNPNLADNLRGYYLLIVEDAVRNQDVAYICLPGADSERVEKGSFTTAPASSWQHTFFQGGFAIIINNGEDQPHYIIDLDGNESIDNVPNFIPLPGWQSYNVQETAIEDTFTSLSSRIFDLNRPVDFSVDTIRVEDISDTSDIISYSGHSLVDQQLVSGANPNPILNAAPRNEAQLNSLLPLLDSEEFAIFAAAAGTYQGNTNITIAIGNKSDIVGRRFRITVESRADVEVRAGVVRSFGDFLVAGNLIEIDSDEPRFNADGTVNPNRIVRNLPGVVRTSDVALPGNIPTNWNPFAAGVSTADEFVISDTGIVQDMVELQGNLYLYSNTSISVLRKTGNAQVPFAATPVTDSYGAQTTGSVLEFDGSHIVVGSQDIYLFGGHPGSIKSIADTRVRQYFFDSLNPLHEDNMFALRYQQKDEVWICYPTTSSVDGECDRALIWNYRLNNWTIRDLRHVVSGDVGPIPGGGIPGAFIELSGTSGNNGVDALGINETQTLVIDSDAYVPVSSQPGQTHITNIEIDNNRELFPSFVGRGPIFHDISIGSNFNSGQGSSQISPLAFQFSLLQADNTFVPGFPIDVILDSETTTALQIRSALSANANFHRYYRIISTDSDSTFVVRTRALPGETVTDPLFDTYIYPDYISGSVTVGGIILADSNTRNQLQRDSECDIFAPANGRFTSSGTTRSYEFGSFVDEDCVDRLYFPDIIGGTNIDSDNISLQVDASMAGDNTRMYEEDGIISTDEMYEEGRGGETERPNRNPGSGDSELNSQDFYQDAFPATQSVTIPWSPTRSGAHSFQVNVPGVGGNQAGYNSEDVRLTAYEVPPPAASNNDTTITTRSSNPVDGVEAPAIVFDTGYYEYDLANDQFVKNTDVTVRVPLYGDYTTGTTDRAKEAALYIRDAFNDEAPSLWVARSRDAGINGFVNLTSVQQQRQFIEIVSVGNPLVRNDFTITDSENGLRAVTVANAQRPRFTITGPGFATPMTTQLMSDSEYTASDIIQELANYIRANDNQRWGFPTLVANHDSEGRHWRVVENDENTPITGAWEISLTSVGNLGLVSDPNSPLLQSAGYRLFNPTFYNSRIARGNQLTGSFLTGDVDVTIGVGDSRGAEFTRATPTLFAIRIRNTSVPQGQELILLSGDNTNNYIPEIAEDNRVNGNRLSNVEILGGRAADAAGNGAHTGWIDTLRLANRRINIFYEPGSSRFRMVPVNYDDLASFALEIVMNDTQDGADRIQALWDMTQGANPVLHLNPYSIAQLPQGTGNAVLSRATVAPIASEIPNERVITYADMRNVGPTPAITFDVDRPWDSSQINPNREYPIFASTQTLDNVLTGNATDVVQLNKVIAADIGWSYPIYSIAQDSDNDSEAYESYVERKELAFTPEFNTETMRAIVLLADGEYAPSLDSAPQRNRLEVRAAGTDYPGEDIDLTDTDKYVMNTYDISESYKIDLRVHGRLLNARITDKVAEANPNPTKFNDRTEWNISGIQIEIAEGGRR